MHKFLQEIAVFVFVHTRVYEFPSGFFLWSLVFFACSLMTCAQKNVLAIYSWPLFSAEPKTRFVYSAAAAEICTQEVVATATETNFEELRKTVESVVWKKYCRQ